MKRFKTMLAIVLCTIACTAGVPVHARHLPHPPIAALNNAIITPFYTYIISVYSNLSISSGVAAVSAQITANRNSTNKVYISMTLQRKNSSGSWSDVKSWSSTFNNYTGSLSKTHSISKGTYRVKGSFTAYTSNRSETATLYSVEKTY